MLNFCITKLADYPEQFGLNLVLTSLFGLILLFKPNLGMTSEITAVYRLMQFVDN